MVKYIQELQLSPFCLALFSLYFLFSPHDSNAVNLPYMTVYAEKTAQSISDTGISMVHISEEEFTNKRLFDFESVSAALPNVMAINNDLGGIGSFRIRGLGLNEFQANFEGPVAVHIDEISFSKPFMLSGGFFDLDSIEVLKGPQTHLFGRNAIAGSVNYYTKQPTDYFTAGITSSFDNNKVLRNEGFISGPLSDELNARLAILTESGGDGPYHNEFNDQDLGEKDLYALRNTYNWSNQLTDVSFSVHLSKNKSELRPYGNQQGKENAAKPIPYSVNQDYYPTADNRSIGGLLRIDRSVGKGSVFTSLTGYEYFNRDQREDPDDTPDATTNIDWFSRINQFSQEFRLHGPFLGEHWSHTSGFYFQDEITKVADSFDYSDSAILSAIAGISPGRLANNFEQEIQSFSIFTHHEIHLSETLELNLGARYSHERTAMDGISFIGTVETFGSKGLSKPIVIIDDVDQSRTDHHLSLNAGFLFKLTDVHSVFGRVVTGFRSGGYDLGFGSSLMTFRPEKVISTELGLRSYILDNTLSFEASLFRTKVRDYQTNVDFVGELIPRRTNVGELISQGAEFSLSWKPNQHWGFNLALGYTDATIKSDETVVGIPIDDNNPVNTPEWSINTGISHTSSVSPNANLTVASQLNWVDERYLEVQNLSQHLADDYYTLDLQLTLEAKNKNWAVSLWGKNITDQDYVVYINDIQPLMFLTINGMPATYGVSLTLNY